MSSAAGQGSGRTARRKGAGSDRRGFTLLEVIGVFAVAVVVIATAVAFLEKLSYERKMHQALEGYSLLAYQVDRFLLRPRNLTGSMHGTLKSAGLLPQPPFLIGLRDEDPMEPDEFFDIFGGRFSLSINSANVFPPDSTVSTPYRYWQIKLFEVPKERCIDMLTRLGFSENPKLFEIETTPLLADGTENAGLRTAFHPPRGRPVRPAVVPTNVKNFPVVPGEADSACTNRNNHLVWRFLMAPAI